MSNEISIRPSTGAIMTIEDAINRQKMLTDFVRKVMVKGRDFGVIPGTEKKPNADGTPSRENNTLLQPGAERLCTLFGLVDEYEDAGSIVDHERGFFHFSFKCILLRNCTRENVDGRTVILGDVAGVAIGSCNSREKKYRRGGKACPECGAIAIKKSKFPPRDRPNEVPGWYCHDKAGGCGMNFAADDQRILEAKQADSTAESFDLINTLQKMAQKRAKLSAVRAATNASDFFNAEDGDDQPGHKEESDETEEQKEQTDWIGLASAASTVDEVNSIVGKWNQIPLDDEIRGSVDKKIKEKVKSLGLVWNKQTRKWDAPAKPEPAKEKEPSNLFVTATTAQIEEIEAMLPASGMTQKEALAGIKDTTGSQMMSVVQLNRDQAAVVLGRISDGVRAQERKGA
jgi:hypothetical protein